MDCGRENANRTRMQVEVNATNCGSTVPDRYWPLITDS